jgi:HSP20 family protein
MDRDSTRNWMWSEACEMLVRAERLHHEFFRLTESIARSPAWQPPADILETDREVLVLVALPGVNPDCVELRIEDGSLWVGGTRSLPRELQTATIHRLELPQGRFERRVPLPVGRYSTVRHSAVDGCLLISLQKL